jgi:serine/threonine protein kinase/Tfp pilus assembly protein PilF
MSQPVEPSSFADLDHFVKAYEMARRASAHADLAAFLPAPTHPHYRAVLCELVRVDLEYAWKGGQPRRLEEYLQRFPELQRETGALREIAFEEYRLRQQAGDQPSPDEYFQRFGLTSLPWPVVPGPLGESDLPATRRTPSEAEPGALGLQSQAENHNSFAVAPPAERGLSNLPRVGTEYLGFHLRAELGRGAFACVYLAQQGDLANRPVALKVSTNVWKESQTLAQLQHTNIVPIYSVHRDGPLQAVCMPYFGPTTLADVLGSLRGRESLPESGVYLVQALKSRQSTFRPEMTRDSATEPSSATPGAPDGPEPPAPAPSRPHGEAPESLLQLEKYSYVDAVLWMAKRLADGLAHAHQRGILHRDLKPANILLTDEGEPMLLDFNLAVDTRQPLGASLYGGTLPYMAPEHIDAFHGTPREVDERSDIFSLGVVLYELLTGRHPFVNRRGPLHQVLADLRAAQRSPLQDARTWNRAVSPAVQSILQHCLAADPAKRYQSANQLRDDVEQQLSDKPLKYAPEPSLRERLGKWRRRHPRATAIGVAVCAVVLLAGLASAFVYRGHRLQQAEKAAEAKTAWQQFRTDAQTAQSLLTLRNDDPERLQKSQSEEGLALGRRVLDRYQVGHNPAWHQQPVVTHLAEEDQAQLRERVAELALLLKLVKARREGGSAATPAALEEIQRLRADGMAPAQEAARQRLLARQHLIQGRFGAALELLEKATAADPTNYWGWFLRATCHQGLAQLAEAVAYYTVCIALAPTSYAARFNRGKVYLRQDDFQRARDDFHQLVQLRPTSGEAYFHRALAQKGLRKYTQAVDDFTLAIANGFPETRVYFARSGVRELAGDLPGAKVDFQEGMKRRPTDEASWNARGLARLGKDPRAALADFEEALKLDPCYLPALQNVAHVLSEKLGRTEEAVQVLSHILKFNEGYVPARAGRGVLLARLGKREAALADARETLVRESTPFLQFQVAGIYALTSCQQPDDRLKAYPLLASALRQGFGFDDLTTDPDLAPLRDQPEFRRLVELAAGWRAAIEKQPAR